MRPRYALFAVIWVCIYLVSSILNKITLEKFDTLSDKLLEVGITSADILQGIISQVFEKALSEPKYVNMYAQLCRKISVSPLIPEFKEEADGGKPIVCISTLQSQRNTR